jgi:hypothetical protein
MRLSYVACIRVRDFATGTGVATVDYPVTHAKASRLRIGEVTR